LQDRRPSFTESAKVLESYYGTDTLEVAPFSRDAFHNGDLISDFLVRTGLDAFNYPEAISEVKNRSLNPLVCDYLAQFPTIYSTEHDNQPKINLEKHKSSEPWLFDPRKDYLNATQRRSILNHFEVENRNLHARYFPDISYELLFGIGISDQDHIQEQPSLSLDKQQLEFLENWVGKWLRSKKTRAFIISKKRLIMTVKKYFSRSL